MFSRILFLSLLALCLLGCEKENDIDNELSQEAFIEALATDPNATEIEYSALPPDITETVETQHFETFAETVEHVPGRGYIIYLASGETLYSREDGQFLEFNAEFRPGGAFGEHPHGRCFRRLRRFGRHLPPAELSETITDYITENYPDQEIRGAKAKGDSTLVGLTGATVLLFGETDEFIKEWNVLEHCSDRCGEVRPAVQTIIEDYISENFPAVEVKRVCRRANRIFVLAKRGDSRLILIFGPNGTFIGRRP